MGRKAKQVDWATVRREYELGRASVRQIADRHGISDTTIRKKAKEKSWTRDLSADVSTRTRQNVARLGYRDDQQGGADPVDPEQAAAEDAENHRVHDALMANQDATDDEIVEHAAMQNAVIVNRQRNNIKEWQALVCRYRDLLKAQMKSGKRSVLVKGGRVTVDIELDYIAKSVTAGTQAVERLVKLERQSYGIDADGGEDEGKSIDELMAETRPDDD